MECLQRFGRPTLTIRVFTTTLVLLLSGCAPGLVFSELFEKFPLQGLSFQIYKSQYQAAANHPGKCALVCSDPNASPPRCKGFVYNSEDGTCDFYEQSDNQVGVSSLQFFRMENLHQTTTTTPTPTTATTTTTTTTTEISLYQTTINPFASIYQTIHAGGSVFYIYLSTETATFFEARTHCNDIGGYVLQFDSLEEYTAVEDIVAGAYGAVWVGANDLENEGHWVTDREGDPLDEMWVWRTSTGEPGGGTGSNCVIYHMVVIGLNDIPCDKEMYFVCEME